MGVFQRKCFLKERVVLGQATLPEREAGSILSVVHVILSTISAYLTE